MKLIYDDMSCTEWFSSVEGGDIKEVLHIAIDSLSKDECIDLVKYIAECYGEIVEETDGSCSQCGHYGFRYEYIVEVEK
jgi:malic enzyme